MIKEISIKSKREEYEIPCIYSFPENMKKIIIAIHGFGSSKTSGTILALIEALYKQDIGVIALDLPAHGQSKESGEYLTVKNCLDDINSVEEYVKQNYSIDIGFFASSFGSYLTLLKINNSNCKYNSVVLRCPAINMAQIFVNTLSDEHTTLNEFKQKGYVTEGYANRFNVTYSMYEDLRKNDVLKNYNSQNNILIIHGTEDEIAPIKDSIKLQEKFSNYIKLEKIEGANHKFTGIGQMDKVLEIATKYFLNT